MLNICLITEKIIYTGQTAFYALIHRQSELLSIFLLNNQKAIDLLPKVSERLILEPVSNISKAMLTNGNLYRPSPKGEEWESYMQAYVNCNFETALREYGKKNRVKICKNQLKRMIPVSIYLFLKQTKSRINSRGKKA